MFGHSTFFVASLVFMKGTSCCVIRRNFIEPSDRVMAKFYRSVGLLDFGYLLRGVRHLYNLPRVCASLWLVSIVSYVFKKFFSLQVFSFKG